MGAAAGSLPLACLAWATEGQWWRSGGVLSGTAAVVKCPVRATGDPDAGPSLSAAFGREKISEEELWAVERHRGHKVSPCSAAG